MTLSTRTSWGFRNRIASLTGLTGLGTGTLHTPSGSHCTPYYFQNGLDNMVAVRSIRDGYATWVRPIR